MVCVIIIQYWFLQYERYINFSAKSDVYGLILYTSTGTETKQKIHNAATV